ncbi:MAG TPA: hypothetical protein VGE36_02060 [Roseateles sp.]
MNDPLGIATESRPLCRSYVCAVFGTLSFKLQGDPWTRAEQLSWALGILLDGQPHYLGSWQLLDQPTCWSCIAHDLHVRGIERLRFVVGPAPAEIGATLLSLHTGVTVLPPFGKFLDQCLIDSLHPGHRPYIERAHEVSTQMDRRFKRAVARYGAFSSADAASALLRRSAERYLATNRPAQAESPPPTRRAYGRSAALPATH